MAAKKGSTHKHSESTIASLIRDHFTSTKDNGAGGAGAYAVLTHVRNSTGFPGTTRTADALVMSLWPSRGLHLIGFEVKISKTDWKKELESPEKAEAIAKFCDQWNVAAPPGIVDPATLPPAWGLYEAHEKKLVRVREATVAKALPITKGFLAALLRCATTDIVHKKDVDDVVETRLKAAVEAELRWRRDDHGIDELKRNVSALEIQLKTVKEAVAQFSGLTGIDVLNDRHDLFAIGQAIDAIRKQRHEKTADELERHAVALRKSAELATAGAAQLRAVATIGEIRRGPFFQSLPNDDSDGGR